MEVQKLFIHAVSHLAQDARPFALDDSILLVGRESHDHHLALLQQPTEGQITKLKFVKRQMNGRGKLDLLQARVVGAM